MRRRKIIRGSLAAALVAFALTGAAQAATFNVNMGDNFFAPSELDVVAGDTVLWTNNGNDDHTVTASGVFNSGNMNPDDTFQRVFNETGAFDYVCNYHGQMTGTITVAPPAALPALRISNAGLREGNRGVRPLTFTVRLSEPATNPVTFRFRTIEGTAVAPQDYGALNAMRTIPAGQMQRAITVWVKGDRRNENRERFSVRLSQPGGAYFGDATGVGTIRDNDP